MPPGRRERGRLLIGSDLGGRSSLSNIVATGIGCAHPHVSARPAPSEQNAAMAVDVDVDEVAAALVARSVAVGQAELRMDESTPTVAVRQRIRQIARSRRLRVRTALRDGTLLVARTDAGLWQQPASIMRDRTLLAEDRVAVLPDTHPLAGRAEIDLAELDGEPFPRWVGAPDVETHRRLPTWRN